jgi:hypothetical protein
MTESVSAWKVHQSAATLQGVSVKCSLTVEIAAEGVDLFKVEFDGRIDKANLTCPRKSLPRIIWKAPQ